MKRKRWANRLLCGVAALTVAASAALAAGGQGSRDDPLVTLSYLNEKAIPDVLRQVDEKVDARVEELEKNVKSGKQPNFSTVEAAAGKTISLRAGCQLLLRSGSGSCIDGLVDLTTGETLGGELLLNHLYIATKDGQTVAISGKATVMVLGGYSLS